MSSRKLDLSTIATTVEKVDMSRAKEIIPNITAIDKANAEASSMLVGNDIGDALKDYCKDKNNRKGKDYVTDLDRLLRLNPGIDICGAASSNNPMDSILVKNAKSRNIKDFSKIVRGSVTTEMSKMDMFGAIPECLYKDILDRISKLSDFGGLSLPKRLDLLGLLNNKCTKDIVNSMANKAVEQEATKGIITGLMATSPTKAYEYITAKSKDGYQTVSDALEGSLNDKECTNTTEKLAAYNELKSTAGNNSISSMTMNENILDNLDKQNADKSSYGDNFAVVTKGIDNMGGLDTYGSLKGKSNLSAMAKDSLANKASTDDMSSMFKSTNMDFAKATILTNAFM